MKFSLRPWLNIWSTVFGDSWFRPGPNSQPCGTVPVTQEVAEWTTLLQLFVIITVSGRTAIITIQGFFFF